VTAAPRIDIDVALPCRRWKRALPDAADRAEAAARAAFLGARQRPAYAEISLVLADDATVRALNRRWRKRDSATNVLSFASAAPRTPTLPRKGDAAPTLLGDVVLAYETIAREAEEQGKKFADHFAHLVTHGVLHLLGFDHVEDAQARRMEALERRVLARLGVADPYRVREGVDG
jgi:probable rRNA maturation factor